MTEIQTKCCAKCKIELPICNFYFRKEIGAFRKCCKKCKSLNTKEEIAIKLFSNKKICKHCNIEKNISEYQKAGKGKWTQPYCKPCDAERKRKYSIDNKDKVVSTRKKYYQDNKSIIIKKNIEYRSKNIDKVKERAKLYRQKNGDIIRDKQREYCKKNRKELAQRFFTKRQANKEYYQEKGRQLRAKRTPEQIVAKKKYDREYKLKNKDKYIKWRKENVDKVREQRRIWGNKKAATDISYRIKRNIRTRIRCALKPNNAYKVDKSQNLLGCSIEFFKKYIESLFTEGMDWDKFMSADIEIDHIKPCAKFDLVNEEEQRKCFHYSNCQPLWWWDNNKKGANYQEQKIA